MSGRGIEADKADGIVKAFGWQRMLWCGATLNGIRTLSSSGRVKSDDSNELAVVEGGSNAFDLKRTMGPEIAQPVCGRLASGSGRIGGKLLDLGAGYLR